MHIAVQVIYYAIMYMIMYSGVKKAYLEIASGYLVRVRLPLITWSSSESYDCEYIFIFVL